MNIYELLLITLIAMTPWLEARVAIPLAYKLLNNTFLAFIIAFTASSLPSIPLVYMLNCIEKRLVNKYRLFKRIYSWTLKRVRNKVEKLRKSKHTIYVALLLYVAIPLPFTGVWTGSLIAYILGLDKRKSIVSIIVGNFIASTIILFIVLGVVGLLNL